MSALAMALDELAAMDWAPTWEVRPGVLNDATLARFLAKIDREGPWSDAVDTQCWAWTASTSHGGYGKFNVPSPGGKSRTARAHRVAHELWVAPIPEGQVIDHLCSVRRCVNPAHLAVVSVDHNRRRQSGRIGASSQHAGVAWHGQTGRWQAYHQHRGHKVWAGRFADEGLAAVAAGLAAREVMASCDVCDPAGHVDAVRALTVAMALEENPALSLARFRALVKTGEITELADMWMGGLS